MKLKTKRLLDHYLGNFCIVGLSFLVRLVGVVLRRNHATLPADTILILKFQGIGSLAIAMPAIRALRLRCKKSKLVFWGTRTTCLLAREMDEFDEVIELDDRNVGRALFSVAHNLYAIYRKKIDWMVDLEVYSKLSVVLGTSTMGRNRAGFAVDSVRLRRFNHTHLVFFNRHHYLGEAYGQLLGLIRTGSLRPAVLSADHFQNKVPSPPPAFIPTEQPYIVINPNAGELSFERRWPLESFRQLIKKLIDRYADHVIVIIGSGKEERRYCDTLATCSGVINQVDRLTLTEAIQTIVHGKLLISNDSAPLHLGLFSTVPVIGLFGPTCPLTYVDQKRPRTHVHYGELYCSPCIHYWDASPCKGKSRCMRSITVEQVFLSCVELLANEAHAAFQMMKGTGQKNTDSYYPGLLYTKDQV